MSIIYIYKNKYYDSSPINKFIEVKRYTQNEIEYITIIKDINYMKHYIFIFISLIIIICINLYASYSLDYQKREHIINIPKEMYYDKYNKILNVDLFNNSCNIDCIDIIIKKDNKIILYLHGISPGESVGGVFIEDSEYLSNLPLFCTIEYVVYNDSIKFSSIVEKVLIVDQEVVYSRFNNEF